MSNRLKFSVVIASSAVVIVLLAGTVVGQNAQPQDAYRHLAVYTEVLSRIKSDYVEEPDMKSVTLGALNGLLESLDPYSSYLSADQYKQYMKLKDSQPGDVGLILSKRFGYLGVVGVAPGSAAAKAGINTGDVIEAIKGVTTRDMPLAYADVMLHGEPGSTVEVTVLRVRRAEPQKMTLARAVLKPAPVAAKILADQIGYLHVPSLAAAGKADESAAAIRDLEKQGARKLILDLRGNAGGLAEQGIALANLFLDKGLIAYLQGQTTGRQDYEADPAKAIFRHPMVVIVNRGTSGGAEIAASALLEHKRAEVVGERSYGDAALRKTIMTDEGAAVILSVAKYYSLSAKSIQDQGVTPTVPMAEVEPFTEQDDDQDRPEPAEPRRTEDNLLKKAIEVLTKGVERAASPPVVKPKETLGDPTLGPLNVPRPR